MTRLHKKFNVCATSNSYGEKKMKLKLGLMFSALMLSYLVGGCAREDAATETEAAATVDVMPEITPADAGAEESDTAFVEYVWMQEGPNFSREALMEKVAFWNGLIDAGEYDMTTVNLLFPREASDNYDFIWVIVWPSAEARDAGWAYWTENDEPSWLKEIEGVFSFDAADAYMFAATTQMQPSVANTTDVFENQFNFCTYAEGKGPSDLSDFQLAHAEFLQAYEAEAGPSGYWYTLLEPTFEPNDPAPDFVWLDLWSTATEKAQGMAYFADSDLSTALDALGSCNRFGFSGLNIRS